MADRPGGGPARTANEKLLDRAVLHAIFVQRFARGQQKRIRTLLQTNIFDLVEETVRKRLAAISSRGRDTGPATTARAIELRRNVKELIERGFSEIAESHVAELIEFATDEAEFAIRGLEKAIPAPVIARAEIEFVAPTAAALRGIVESKAFEGATTAEWWSGLAADTQARVDRTIRGGMGAGQTVDEMTNRLLGDDGLPADFAASRRNAEAIVRTGANQISADANQMVSDENRDLFDGWRFVATLDARTTLECAGLDGKVFANDDLTHAPPVHWGCRSRKVDILKSWREFGFDFDEIPGGSRASLNGTVPKKTTYDEWLRSQPAATQDLALGPGRAKLFREGMKIERFTDETGETLTLEELRGRNGSAHD